MNYLNIPHDKAEEAYAEYCAIIQCIIHHGVRRKHKGLRVDYLMVPVRGEVGVYAYKHESSFILYGQHYSFKNPPLWDLLARPDVPEISIEQMLRKLEVFVSTYKVSVGGILSL